MVCPSLCGKKAFFALTRLSLLHDLPLAATHFSTAWPDRRVNHTASLQSLVGASAERIDAAASITIS